MPAVEFAILRIVLMLLVMALSLWATGRFGYVR